MSLRAFTPPRYVPSCTGTPGIRVCLPGSPHALQLFPTAFRLFACSHSAYTLIHESFFPDQGPIVGWKAEIDVLRHMVIVEGKGREGLYRYSVKALPEGIVLQMLKSPMNIETTTGSRLMGRGETMVLSALSSPLPLFPTPRLLLGCHKASNWDRISACPCLEEVLPVWYLLSSASGPLIDGSPSLLGRMIEAVRQKNVRAVFPACSAFFRAGITGFFVPKRDDDLFLGYPEPLLPDAVGLPDVHDIVRSTVRSLFLQEDGPRIELLPCLPHECVCGHLLNETLRAGHRVSIEWRKGAIRRMVIQAVQDGPLVVHAAARSAVIRRLGTKDRGRQFCVGEELVLKKAERYLVDNFAT